MENFRAVFEAYGADYDVTLRRFLGNEAMYLRLLGLLPKDASVETLGQALAQGDLKRAFEAAHTLKGVAGNLGLTPLYQAVCAIVEPLRTGAQDCDYQALYGAVRSAYRRAEQFLSDLEGLEAPL